jgi:hypothetical protein
LPFAMPEDHLDTVPAAMKAARERARETSRDH